MTTKPLKLIPEPSEAKRPPVRPALPHDQRLHFAAFEGSPYFSLEDALNDFLDEVGPISIVHMTQSYIATGKHQDETCLAVTLFYRHGSAT
jgi:hypothetical protein